MLNQGGYQSAQLTPIFFSTYGGDSAATLTAVGGNVVLNDDSVAVVSALSGSFLSGAVTNAVGGDLDILPPTVTLVALSGNVDIGRTIATSPSPTGNLQVFANQNVVGTVSSSGLSGQLILSDADPSELPSPVAPSYTTGVYDDITRP